MEKVDLAELAVLEYLNSSKKVTEKQIYFRKGALWPKEILSQAILRVGDSAIVSTSGSENEEDFEVYYEESGQTKLRMEVLQHYKDIYDRVIVREQALKDLELQGRLQAERHNRITRRIALFAVSLSFCGLIVPLVFKKNEAVSKTFQEVLDSANVSFKKGAQDLHNISVILSRDTVRHHADSTIIIR